MDGALALRYTVDANFSAAIEARVVREEGLRTRGRYIWDRLRRTPRRTLDAGRMDSWLDRRAETSDERGVRSSDGCARVEREFHGEFDSDGGRVAVDRRRTARGTIWSATIESIEDGDDPLETEDSTSENNLTNSSDDAHAYARALESMAEAVRAANELMADAHFSGGSIGVHHIVVAPRFARRDLRALDRVYGRSTSGKTVRFEEGRRRWGEDARQRRTAELGDVKQAARHQRIGRDHVVGACHAPPLHECAHFCAHDGTQSTRRPAQRFPRRVELESSFKKTAITWRSTSIERRTAKSFISTPDIDRTREEEVDDAVRERVMIPIVRTRIDRLEDDKDESAGTMEMIGGRSRPRR